MRDEFPELEPKEQVSLQCMVEAGLCKPKEKIDLHYADFSEGDKQGDEVLTFAPIGAELLPENFLRTQRELRQDAKMRAMVKNTSGEGNRRGVRGLSKKVLRARVRRRLRNRREKEMMGEFRSEVATREAHGVLGGAAAEVARASGGR